MMTADFAPTALPNRGVLNVAGPEARAFLERLITTDVERLKPGDASYGALLSPQGKIQFDFFLIYTVMKDEDGTPGDVFMLECAKSQLTALTKRLELYRLRAKVLISPVVNLQGYASAEEPKFAARKFRDPRTPQIGWRAFARIEDDHKIVPGYDAVRIRLGLADSEADLGAGDFFPHEANFDQLGAVSFTKGCYVGQEVVSRMEHRGTARSRILPVRVAGGATPKGTEIVSGGKVVGTMLSSEGSDALALLRLDRLTEASGPLLTEGVPLQVMKPRWVRYDVPGAKDVD
jgi:folate-binding protein YgfZ